MSDGSLKVRDFPVGERPRERLVQYGARCLSSAELLSIILRTGSSKEGVTRLGERLLTHFGGLENIAATDISELTEVKGIGQAKAAEIKAAFELGRRLMGTRTDERPIIKSPADAANYLMAEMAHFKQEHVVLLLLDTRNRVLAAPTVYKGNVNSASIRAGEIFRYPIRANAATVIMVHNHPSGDPTPSSSDIIVTRQLVAAGKLLQIELIDHLIIG